ncbi:glycolipid 2-alpha-mannosyltransferase [Hirsutella rhossiliensis]|uniref:Glycolipid 2-alpha-mannosyltransferase domain-containing protein n=1 Tax=Hirsutella rhossiliensis TaxID=111463 RepID=A0A9P8MNV7_9HYPO|nr:glycolipid 2-alpha-mannosyltransferase domain-containing protein [Hirsutella rhossiliensis]KAH0958555.1 glycolipid 2-alpha-mannosyltransferase domain-containing protein [Hirsutella rhossiliensis]
MNRAPGPVRWFSLCLALGACLCVWFGLLLPSNKLAVSMASADRPPRAVIVSLAHEHDLRPILSSISQLEETFNSRHRYDWVFFSTRPLSEQFRRLTSNATKAACLYDVIDNAHPSVPGDAHDPQLDAQCSVMERDDDPYEATPLARRIRRWKSGAFAKENRLKGYDWFWIVEPGAQFNHNIDFDVFRVMRHHGIAYGSNKAGVDGVHLRKLSRHVRRFVDENPGLVHAEADISWLLGSGDGGQGAADDFDPEAGDAIVAQDYEALQEGLAESFATGGWQGEGGDGDNAGAPIEVFASRLGSIYRSSLWPAFEIGSLAFLRSQSHQALFEHLDKAGDLYYRGFGQASTPTLSASMFLPQKSVLRIRVRDKRYARGPSPPDSTPNPKLNLARIVRDIKAASAGAVDQREAMLLREAMADWQAFWELVAVEFDRQGRMPDLQSGNTVVDERNFQLDKSKPKPKPKPIRLVYRMVDYRGLGPVATPPRRQPKSVMLM